jgi:hemolysin activation/secretion protein
VNSALGRTQLGIFADYGYVRNARRILPDPYESNSGAMSGIGGGLHYSGKYLNWSLTYARTLSAPEYLQTRDGIPREEQSIYWRFSASY